MRTVSWMCIYILTIGMLSNVNGNMVKLNGAGASFPNQVYERWIAGYKHHRSRHALLDMTYESVGSGAGKARMKGEQGPKIHFGGSDYPLDADELSDHPDLIQFPTIAGSVVLAYNIPGIDNLTLSMDTVVGIYNGTYRRWDDPRIQELNPSKQMPAEEITVLVRSDKSGTTYAFTNCLSSYSPSWRREYGTFSQGLGSNRRPIYWNGTFIKFYGNTNDGMTGMVVTLVNSIGYMSIADAIKSQIPYALIQKSPGNVVQANVESVQKAIIYANDSLDIANSAGPDSYPFASFTFIITRYINLEDCDAMVEFVRFIEWSFYNDIPRQDTIDLHMIPLDFTSIDNIKTNILKSITCRGSNVWDMYLIQLRLEKQEVADTSWMIPTYGGFGVLLAVIVTLAILFGHHQYRIHRDVLNDNWRLSASKIIIDKRTIDEHKKQANTKSNGSVKFKRNSIYSESTLADQAWLEHDNIQGIYDGSIIILSETSISKMSMKDKKIAIFMRDNIKHKNIMPFVGLTMHRVHYLAIYSGVSKGTILDVLKNPKYHINNNCVVGFIKNLAEGMKFLHRKGIVHGNLRGSNCMVDTAWNLKITGWCENKIVERTFISNTHIDTTGRVADNLTARELFWTAPELIKFNRPPSQAGDVYSFGMVVQEMLTGADPFSELDKTASDIITAVITCSLRPKFSPNTHPYITRLLEGTWDMDPSGRPTFTNICHGLASTFPKDVSVLDSIIESFEGYVDVLEQRLKESEGQRKKLQQDSKAYLNHTAPACILDKILDGRSVPVQSLKGVSAIVLLISNIDDVTKRVTTDGLFNTFKHFYSSLDAALVHDDLYIVERHAEKTVFARGLPTYDKNHAENACFTALAINTLCQKFNRNHLESVNAEFKYRIGIASSSALSGVLTSSRPKFTAYGRCFVDATRLAMTASENTIRLSPATFEDVKYSHNLSIGELLNEKEQCYQLHEAVDTNVDTVVHDIENNSYA